MKVVFTQGLQGSGKSTWAKMKAMDPEWKRVNRDDLRLMLDNERFNPKNENFITVVEDQIIASAIASGYNIIIDSMNLNTQRIRERFAQISRYIPSVVCEIKSFRDVPLEECLKRDSVREFPVGEFVIRKTYNKHFDITTGELL